MDLGAQTRLITNWLSKEPNIPFLRDGVDCIVLTTEYEDEALVDINTQGLLQTAADKFMRYYHPARWYSVYRTAEFEEQWDVLRAEATAARALAGASQLPVHLGGTTRGPGSGMKTADAVMDLNGDILDMIGNILTIVDRKKSDRPGSRYRVLVVAPEHSNMRTHIMDPNEPANPGYRFPDASTRYFDGEVATWALEKWSTLQNFSGFERTITIPWKGLGKQIETVKKIFTKYHTQKRHFDGQVIPDINFEKEFESLSNVISVITKLIKLNGFKTPASDEDEVSIDIDDNYRIAGIRYFQPNTSLNWRPVVVGFFAHMESDAFNNFQTISYLSKWQSLLDLEKPQRVKFYQYFINFIKDFSNVQSPGPQTVFSASRTYRIDYCGPSHSPPAMTSIIDGPPTDFQDQIGLGPGAIQVEGVVNKKDNVLSLTFSNANLQNKFLRDPANRQLILDEQLTRVEQKAQDAIETVMTKLREIQNSEELSVVKEILNKVGIDVLIIEAIKCISFNSNFNPNSVISDVRDVISASKKLFAKRQPPKGFSFPELKVDIPIFSITGNLHEIIKQMILEALMEVARALVQAMADIIKEACSAKDLSGGDYGELNLGDMFNTQNPDSPQPYGKPPPPGLLGGIGGLNICFDSYNIPEAVGMTYLTEISEILTPSEICQLLKGTPAGDVLAAVTEYSKTYNVTHPVRQSLSTSTSVAAFFTCLGDLVDIDSICQRLIEESILPNLDDLCLTEEKILTGVDTFNLSQLLNMLESGVQIETPEINLSCPQKPGYLPNPLVDRSIPQMINAFAEVISISFYLAVDGVAAVLLIPAAARSSVDGVCGSPVQIETNSPPDIAKDIMADISTAFKRIAGLMQDGGAFEAALNTCDLTLGDVFPNLDGGTELLNALAELFENFDFGASAELTAALDSGVITGMMPVLSYEFPLVFKENTRTAVPPIRFANVLDMPSFELKQPSGTTHYFSARNPDGRGAFAKSSAAFQGSCKYYFAPNSQSVRARMLYRAHSAILNSGLESGAPIRMSINAPGLNRVIQIGNYDEEEMLNNLGESVANATDDNLNRPPQDAFATMVRDALAGFFIEYGQTPPSGLYDTLYDVLKNSYYHSAQAGLFRALNNHVLEKGLFSTDGVMGLSFMRDNTNCATSPSKVGDLMDTTGIAADVMEEYNEAACAGEETMEEMVEDVAIYASILLFLQISVVQFYLQNISVFSAFKLEDIWKLSIVREFVVDAAFKRVQEFLDESTMNSKMGDFSTLFVNNTREWMRRKINRNVEKLDKEILMSLGIQPGDEEELLENLNSIKYLLLWRMERSATAIQNILSNPDASSIDDVLLQHVVGGSHPFIQPFDSDKLHVDSALVDDPPYPIIFHFEVDEKRPQDTMDLLGYGGFKLESYWTWDSVDLAADADLLVFTLDAKGNYKNQLKLSNSFYEPEEYIAEYDAINYVAVQKPLGHFKASTQKMYEAYEKRHMARIRDSEGDLVWTGGTGAAVGDYDWDNDDVEFNNLKLKYRLVYYPPLEASPGPGILNETDPGSLLWAHSGGAKLSTLMPLYESAVGRYAGDTTPGLAAERTPEMTIKKRNNIFNREEALVPISPAWREEIIVTPGSITEHETVTNTARPWSAMWDCPGDGWPFSTGNRTGGCYEPDKPSGQTLQAGEMWTWIPDTTGAVKRAMDQLLPHDKMTAEEFPKQGTQAPAGFPLSAGERSDFAGAQSHPGRRNPYHWGYWKKITETTTPAPTVVDEVVTGGDIKKMSELVTIGIPIMEFDGNQEYPKLSMLDGGESVFRPLRNTGPATRYFRQSPDYDKFKYFFSNVLSKDVMMTTLLLNNFYLTDSRYGSKLKDLFSDAANNAAQVFLLALESPDDVGVREDRKVGLPGINNPVGGAPTIDVRGFILKALRETPLNILKGLCEIADPHVAITKLIKDISGIVIDGVIDAIDTGMDVGLAATGAAAPGLDDLIALGKPDTEKLVEFMFCELNRAMQGKAADLWDDDMDSAACEALGISPPADLPSKLLPTFTTKGINFTGTIPGLFMAPPGPLGLIYLLLNLLNFKQQQETAQEEAQENSC